MIVRSRFFVASLWAAMAPVGMLVAGALWLVFFPEVHRLGELVHWAGWLALIAVPFAYTAVVVATYGIGRVLYELRVLSRFALILVYALLCVAAALIMTWILAAGSLLDIVRSFALFLTLSLVAAGTAVFVWWRVVSRGKPEPGIDADDYQARGRRRARHGFFRRIAGRHGAPR